MQEPWELPHPLMGQYPTLILNEGPHIEEQIVALAAPHPPAERRDVAKGKFIRSDVITDLATSAAELLPLRLTPAGAPSLGLVLPIVRNIPWLRVKSRAPSPTPWT